MTEKQKMPVGIIVLGLLFIVFGIFSLTTQVFMVKELNNKEMYQSIEESLDETLGMMEKGMVDLESELKEAGNWDKFVAEYEKFKKEAEIWRKDFLIDNIHPTGFGLLIIIGFVFPILCILSGIGLFLRKGWGRKRI